MFGGYQMSQGSSAPQGQFYTAGMAVQSPSPSQQQPPSPSPMLFGTQNMAGDMHAGFPMIDTTQRMPSYSTSGTDSPRTSQPTQRSSASTRQTATPARPKPIKNLKEAAKLYKNYKMACKQEQELPRRYDTGQLNVPAPATSRSAPSRTPSRLHTASRSTSVQGGATDPSTVIDFAGEDSAASAIGRGSVEGRSVYDGTAVKGRVRRKLTPVERAKAALIRYLHACSSCHARSVSVSRYS